MNDELFNRVGQLEEDLTSLRDDILKGYERIKELESSLGGKMDRLLINFSNLLLRLSSIEKISENAAQISALKSMYTNLEGRFTAFKTDFIASCEQDINKNQGTIEKAFDHLKH